MRKCEYKLQRGPNGVIGDHLATYEYGEGDAEFPMLKRMVLTDLGSEGNAEGETVTDLTLALRDVPAREFTLTAFGLPEPVGMPAVDRGGLPWYAWLSLAAVGVLVVGGIVVMLKRHYSRVSMPAEAARGTKEGGK